MQTWYKLTKFPSIATAFAEKSCGKSRLIEATDTAYAFAAEQRNLKEMSAAKYAGLPDIVTYSLVPRASCTVHALPRTQLRTCMKHQIHSRPLVKMYVYQTHSSIAYILTYMIQGQFQR